MKLNSKCAKLILGTVQLGTHYGVNNKTGRPSKEESLKILTLAQNKGVKALDTAEAYGEAHALISEALKQGLQFKIYSKFTLHSPLEVTVERCLQQLQLSSLDLFSFHSFKDLQNFTDWKLLKKLCQLDKVKKWGVSVYTPEEALISAQNDLISTIQIPFNLLDNLERWEEALQRLKDLGKEVHVRSIFLQGLFLKRPSELTGPFAPLRVYLESISELAQGYGLTVRELAMHFPFSVEGIDGVLMGVDSLPQLELNLSDLGKILPSIIWSEVKRIKVKEVELLNPANWPK